MEKKLIDQIVDTIVGTMGNLSTSKKASFLVRKMIVEYAYLSIKDKDMQKEVEEEIKSMRAFENRNKVIDSIIS